MKYILATGGCGFIGSHTVCELLNEGYPVVIADNLSNSTADVVDRIEKITGKRPEFCLADVCDKKAVEQIFDTYEIGAVIHFAGLKAVGESVGMPLAYYRNNIDSTLTLLEVMTEHNVGKFIFSSSATVYSDLSAPPYREDAPTGGCTNPYGQTKYFIERILTDAAKADENLSVVLLRYFNPIGAHPTGWIGERPNGIPNNLLPYITQTASGELPMLTVFGNDYETKDGTGVRDYIHVVDLAKGHVKALAYTGSHTGVEVFNLGTGTGYSVLEIIRTFSEVNGVPVPYQIGPRREGDLAESYACPEKAETVLGWKANLTLNDMCCDAWNWQKKLSSGEIK